MYLVTLAIWGLICLNTCTGNDHGLSKKIIFIFFNCNKLLILLIDLTTKSIKISVQQTMIIPECVYLVNTECSGVMLNPLQYTIHHNGIHVYKHSGTKINNTLTDHFNLILIKNIFNLKYKQAKPPLSMQVCMHHLFQFDFLLCN